MIYHLLRTNQDYHDLGPHFFQTLDTTRQRDAAVHRLQALGYNVTLGIVGGLSPLVATWLVNRTLDEFSPAYMIMLAAVVSFLSICTFSERSREPLEAAAVAAA